MVDTDEATSIARDIVGTLMEEGIPKPLARAALGIAYARLNHKPPVSGEIDLYLDALDKFTTAFFTEGMIN